VKTLLLDQTTWDICLDSNGDLAVASDPYSVAQDVASAIRLFAGELWYNTSKGVPYFGQILGRFPAVQLIKAQLIKAAFTVPGVTGAVPVLSILKNRELVGQITVTYDATKAVVSFASSSTGLVTSVGV
jgi:hypothetical protein